MAQPVSLRAESRAQTGKGAARQLRRGGKIPAVVYGHNRAAEALHIDAQAFSKLLGTVSGSTVLDLTIDSAAPVKALIREVQRNPVRLSEIVHIDLYEIRADEKVTVDVAVHVTGTAEGVRNFGGVLDQQLYHLNLRCYPADIPEEILVDVSALNIGQSIHVSDVKIDKVEILNDPSQTVAVVVAPRVEEVAAPVEAAAPAEPELIRKPKAEEGAEEEESE